MSQHVEPDVVADPAADSAPAPADGAAAVVDVAVGDDAAGDPSATGPRAQAVVEWVGRARDHLAAMHPAAWITAFMVGVFAIVFGSLGVQNHRNFGTWSYDMAIYDQAFWLVSRGESFITVRGMNVWGHHVNLVALLFVPFYWLGAGPSFLYAVQAVVLGLGGWPVYLIARDLFSGGRHGSSRWAPWIGAVFAFVFLMYAPVQWISWAMFHPEALAITPLLFAWWFGMHQRWRGFFVFVLLALSTREDVALAVFMLGFVLWVVLRAAPDQRRIRRMCVATSVLGLAWYVISTRYVMVWFNDGDQPFYVQMFYGHYGSTMPEVIGEIVRRPDRVASDAVQPDRLTFYKQLLWPLGFTPLANPLALLMALPQMLASVIGLSPYARMIRFQYTSVMIAPIIISSIYGGYVMWRFQVAKVVLPLWLIGCAYVTNVAWSPSPLGVPETYAVWSTPHPRHESLRRAVALIPEDASVSASYQLLPHLAQRREAYDWPNPFTPAIWGNDDCKRLPDPTTVEWVALDLGQIGENNRPMFDAMRAPGGPFETVYVDDVVIVLRRNGTSPEVDVQPQADSCRALLARRPAG
jgi:uncharacterized membrane protein